MFGKVCLFLIVVLRENEGLCVSSVVVVEWKGWGELADRCEFVGKGKRIVNKERSIVSLGTRRY